MCIDMSKVTLSSSVIMLYKKILTVIRSNYEQLTIVLIFLFFMFWYRATSILNIYIWGEEKKREIIITFWAIKVVKILTGVDAGHDGHWIVPLVIIVAVRS